MNRMSGFIGVFLLSLSIGVYGEEPLLLLDEGDNLVFFSIVNRGKESLTELRVEVKESDLPSWIKVGEIVQPINVPENARSTEKIILPIQITEGKAGVIAELSVVLQDSGGRVWQFKTKIKVREALPQSYALMQNTPNPFNPSTVIEYSLGNEKPIYTQLEVINNLGQKVRTLVAQFQGNGTYSVTWDGLDDHGQKISSGVYFYRLISGPFVETRKMVLTQ